MIIGSGFIANSFRKSNFNTKDYIIFASGVSNSKEDKSKNFEREVKLLKKYSKFEKSFIYFRLLRYTLCPMPSIYYTSILLHLTH